MSTKDAKFFGEGLTYDDVLLVPAYSEVLPRDAELTSRFSRNIELKTPIISAAWTLLLKVKWRSLWHDKGAWVLFIKT